MGTMTLDTRKQDSNNNSTNNDNKTTSNNSKPDRPNTDTISDYPLKTDADYDKFAESVALRVLQNKAGTSSVQQSQRILRFAKTLCKKLCDDKSMRIDEVNLLKSYMSVLYTDKQKQQPKKTQNKVTLNTKPNIKSSNRNVYNDDDYDDYDDQYDEQYNEDNFM